MYEDLNNLFVVKFIGLLEINYINIVDDISYYIRYNKFSFKKDLNGNFIIVDKKYFYDKICYSVKFDDKFWLLVIKDLSIEVG